MVKDNLEWILCPICGNKTRDRIREDTILENYPLYCPKCKHVETVVLLSKLKSTPHVDVEISLDELDLSRAESKATYEDIKQYILEHTGLNVSQLYIAQVKRKHGLIEHVNYHPGEGKTKVPQVTPEKEKAIEDALRYFQMI